MSDFLAQVPFEYLADAAAALPCAGPASQPELVDVYILSSGRFRIRFDAVRHGDADEAWWRWSAGSAQRIGLRTIAGSTQREAAAAGALSAVPAHPG